MFRTRPFFLDMGFYTKSIEKSIKKKYRKKYRKKKSPKSSSLLWRENQLIFIVIVPLGAARKCLALFSMLILFLMNLEAVWSQLCFSERPSEMFQTLYSAAKCQFSDSYKKYRKKYRIFKSIEKKYRIFQDRKYRKYRKNYRIKKVCYGVSGLQMTCWARFEELTWVTSVER